MKINRWLALVLVLLLLPLMTGCFAFDLLTEYVAPDSHNSSHHSSDRDDDDRDTDDRDDSDREYPDSPGSVVTDDIAYEYIVPNPAMFLMDASMESSSTVLNTDGTDRDFMLYIFYFESTEYNDGGMALLDYENYFEQYYLDFALTYSEDYYMEFTISSGSELMGYLTTEPGCWGLYLLPHVALEGVTGESSFADRPVSSGGSTGGGSASSGGSREPCAACDTTGRCGTCGGDTIAHNPYTGEDYECVNCDPSGECKVCDGEGYWYYD